MCISPQANRSNLNNYFKTKEKIIKKSAYRNNYNKGASNSRKISSRNVEKISITKKNALKRVLSNF